MLNIEEGRGLTYLGNRQARLAWQTNVELVEAMTWKYMICKHVHSVVITL